MWDHVGARAEGNWELFRVEGDAQKMESFVYVPVETGWLFFLALPRM